MAKYLNVSAFRIEYNENKGFHTISNISSKTNSTLLIQIPYETLFLAYDEFLFKDELLEAMSRIPQVNETIQNPDSSLLSGLILSARLYIEKFINI